MRFACTGKTLQSIALLASLTLEQQLSNPHLVVVPLSVLGNWLREIAFWCPQLKAQKLHGNKEERAAQKEILLEGKGFHVCVTTYETVSQEVGCLKKIPFEMLVIDEAHRLKNETSKLATLLRQLTSARRLLLTGTPLQNNLEELWTLLHYSPSTPSTLRSVGCCCNWRNCTGSPRMTCIRRGPPASQRSLQIPAPARLSKPSPLLSAAACISMIAFGSWLP